MGIDYGFGLSNIDHATGIRYGVLGLNDVSQEALEWEGEWEDAGYDDWYDEVARALVGCFENGDDYADTLLRIRDYTGARHEGPNEKLDEMIREAQQWREENEDAQVQYEEEFFSELIDMYAEYYESNSDNMVWVPDDSDYEVQTTDIGHYIMKSPWVTRAYYCSPCAPGAGDLGSCEKLHDEDGHLTGDCWAYCLDTEFFDEHNPMPYVAVSLMKMAELDDYEYRLTMQEGA